MNRFRRVVISCAALGAILAAGVLEAQQRPDLTGIYRSASGRGAANAEADMPLTADARRRVDAFNALLENGVTAGGFCLSYGMPGIAARPVYPVEFIERSDFITIIYELHQQIRHVYLNIDAVPDDVFPTRNGFSIGHWEGNTLVVETTNLMEWLERYPHSEQTKVLERYTVSQTDDGKKLDVDISVVDPVFYTEPLRMRRTMVQSVGARLLDYDCTEPQWLDYIEQRRAELEAGGEASE